MKKIILVFMILLFLPKINIVGSRATSGVRIDDLYLFFLVCIIFFNITIHLGYNKFLLSFQVFRIILFIMIISLISLFFNYNFFKPIFLLYIFRLLEYSFIIFIGYYCYYYSINIIKNIIYYGLINCIIVILQRLNIVGGFKFGTYVNRLSGRPIGLTAGPWEVSVVLVFVMILSIKYIKSKKLKTILTIFYLFVISISGSRIGLLSALVILLLLNKQHLVKFVIIGSILLVSLSPILINLEVVKRSANLFKIENLQFIFEAYDKVDTSSNVNISVNNIVSLSDQSRDVSWLMRITKWLVVIKTNLKSIYTTILGHLPGYFGSAIDGSYIRIFGELGVLGLLSYFYMLKKMCLNDIMKFIIITLLINMLFIDVIYAYKIMCIIFLLYGYYWGMENYEKSTCNSNV